MSPANAAPEQAAFAPHGLNGAADARTREHRGEIFLAAVLEDGEARVRFRGRSLDLAGALYPYAHFTIHRVGAPGHTDLQVDGDSLRIHFGQLGNHVHYRIDMNDLYLSRAAHHHGVIGWGKSSVMAEQALSLTLDDYVNVLKLGEAVIKRWMLFVWRTNEDDVWAVAPQVEGKVYSVTECLDILCVPDRSRQDVTGFGPRAWTVGSAIPRCYLAKDLPIKFVISKIGNVMRTATCSLAAPGAIEDAQV